MSEFEIRVVKVRPLKKKAGRVRRLLRGLGRMTRAALMSPRALMVAGFLGFIAFAGTPHAGWEYVCNHPMREVGSCRSVAWCAYYGVQGRGVEVPPHGQQCSPFKVLPLDWEAIMRNL